MASVTQTIPQFSLGMSEQPDNLKFPGQVSEIVNAIPDVTKGLFKRPGAKRIGSNPLATVQSGGSWFHYFRDETEGSYIGQVAADGQVRVWRCSDGDLMTTLYGAAAWDSTEDYFFGDRVQANNKVYEAQATINSGGSAPSHSSGTTNNWLYIEATSTSQTTVQNYLNTSDPENLQFLTINDTTFVSNRDDSNANTLVGSTGTTQAAPNTHFAMLELLRTENGRQYGLDIFNTAAVTSLSRTTRIKIKSDTLFEGAGSGSCPGIGTEVFSVSAASSYTGTTTEQVRSTILTPATVTGGASAVNTGSNYITFTSAHNFADGDPVVYTTGTTVIGGLTSGTTYYVRNGPVSGGVSLYFYTSAANAISDTSVISLTNQGGAAAHTFTPTTGVLATSEKDNLIFRLDILGQQGINPNSSSTGSGDDYVASYQREVVLLHGGEGWAVGDEVIVRLDSAKGGGGSSKSNNETTPAKYTLVIDAVETTEVNATVVNPDDGLIRPEPTPFDAQTAVTADTIIGGIINALPTAINHKVIGNGIYLYSDTQDFVVNVVEQDLMRVMQSSVNDVQGLPNQCKNGYIVKVDNALRAEEDDYYLKFVGENGKDGTGTWVECAKPGIAKTLTNMPLVIQRTATTTFTVRPFVYFDRTVGDDFTNPLPSFVGNRINKVLFFRNRLAFLSGENVVTSRPGTLGKPDFFIETALTVSTSDPVDISSASMFPSDLFDGIEIAAGLLIFSTNQQFLLAADDTVFNPDTAKLRSISTFNYNKDLPPISLGTTIAYIDNSGKFGRFNEMANAAREAEPNILEVSKIVPTLLPRDADLITNSRENSIVLIGKTGSDEVYGYKYFQTAEKRSQAAWFKWKLNNPIIYHFIINDEYFFLDSDYYLQSIKLVQTQTDPSIVQDDVDFLLHVDNYTSVSGGSFNPTTNVTTFSGPTVLWVTTVTSPNHDLVIVDSDPNSVRVGRYAKPTISGATFTVPGKWTDTYTIGYIYPYEVKLPTLYPTKAQGGASSADVNSSLVLHRVKFHFGKVGLYETTLERVGKNDYTEVYESTQLDEYKVSDAPYLEEFIKTVPVYEKNTNVDITLRSSHPAPATLRSLSWEGDYSPKYYKRV